MRICFDTETPTRYNPDGIPDVVCLTWAPESDKSHGRIATGNDAIDLWDAWIANPNITLIAHNAPFDVSVMAKASGTRGGVYTRPGFGPAFEQVFRAYEAGRIIDTIPDQRLIDVARGRAGDDTRMGTLAKRLLQVDMSDDKGMPKAWVHLLGTPVVSWPSEARDATPWRFKYGLLQGIPADRWPEDARRYACDDPVITWGIRDWQEKQARKIYGHGKPIANSREQTRAALDLHLHSLTGFCTDRPRVQNLIKIYAKIEEICSDLLVAHCALCGDPVVEMPAPADVKDALADGAEPGDPRLGHCPKCKERCTLVREDVKWRARRDGKPRTYKGEIMRESRRRVKDRKAAQRLVWLTLGRAAPQTKTAREKGLAHTQATTGTDADTMVQVAAKLADGREGLLMMPAVLRYAQDGTLNEEIAATPLPVVNAVRLYSRAQKYQSAFLAPLDTDRRVRTSYQVCKDTGRTSARKPNVQNFPRPDKQIPKELDIRSCITPDPGHKFLVCDYSQIELVGFAHVLNILGRMQGRGGESYESSLAKAINGGLDGHIKVAAEVLGVSYAVALAAYKDGGESDFARQVARWRQVGKIQNYGAAGGMGAATFVAHAAKQDAIISYQESAHVRQAWLHAWSPDVPAYFRWVGDLTANGRADIVQLYSGRMRGRATFTQICNSFFQGLCADGAKEAMRLIVDACFRDQTSPLYGCRPSLFVHDEFVVLCPDDQTARAAPELSRLMIAGMRKYINDIVIKADCDIMERWGKG